MKCLVFDQVDEAVSKVADKYFKVDCGNSVREEPEFLMTSYPAPERWGLILAGGDGTRLQGLTRIISGDDRPKQFCRLVGSRTLLQQATDRAKRSISPHRTLIALTRAHARFYERDLAGSQSTRLIQPCNRGTAPAIIVGLLEIARRDPAAKVAILPSDHYYSDEDTFAAALQCAFEVATSLPGAVVLLGAQPTAAEIEFGWIELGSSAGEDLYHVRSFQEKPTLEAAGRLFASGALWNTFVVVGSVNALLDIAFSAVPELVINLSDACQFNARGNSLIPRQSVYDGIPSTDFSRRVLASNAHKLLALRLHSMDWHDLGQPDRVVSLVRAREENLPSWMLAWEAGFRPRTVA